MKTLILFIFTFTLLYTTAQDVIITVSGFQFETPLELDTIRIENLSNGSYLSLSGFPSGVFNYPVNLSKGIYNSIYENQIKEEQIEIYSNWPGLTKILVYVQNKQTIKVELFDLLGRKQLQSGFQCQYGLNLIQVKTTDISLIRVVTSKSQKVFKSLGSPENGTPEISKTFIRQNENGNIVFKNNAMINSFVYSPGDSLKIIASKTGYYSGFVVKIPVNLDHYDIYLSKPCEGVETVADYDGNIYNTVQIGTQCWMKENLNATHYADGTPLVDGTGIPTIDITTKYWFNYEDNPAIAEIYGKLYSWAAVMNDEPSSNSVPSGVQGVCPEGWHVPSKAEWEILVEKFGGNEIAGGKLKETGYEHWNHPNTGADNQSGFTALGNGIQSVGNYGGLKIISSFWTSTLYSGPDSYYVSQDFDKIENTIFGYQGLQQKGRAIRCIKD